MTGFYLLGFSCIASTVRHVFFQQMQTKLVRLCNRRMQHGRLCPASVAAAVDGSATVAVQ